MTGNEFIEKVTTMFRLTLIDGSLKFPGEALNVIEVNEVLRIFNEITNLEEDEFAIYYNDHDGNELAEIAVALPKERFRLREDRIIKETEDEDNQVKYKMEMEGSDYYTVWLYKKLFEELPNWEEVRGRWLYRMLFNRSRSMTRRLMGNRQEITLLDIMGRTIECGTLKITKSVESNINLGEAINSFSYTYMCNMNTPIKVYSIEEAIGIPNRRKIEMNDDFEAPKRKYNSNLIDYYNLAISSEDPFVSFISYYHIIEYFFDEVFREQQINTLKTSITSPRFSYKDDEQLFNIIKKIIKDNRLVKENGSGNEQQSLNYVLHKFIISLDDFKQRLSAEELTFYQNSIVTFSNGNTINWDRDKDSIIKGISNRIYKTRNALIHSKSSKKEETYHPYLHKNELKKEISLIKVVAECLIENDSALMGE
ncbi:hypothetical protein [Bacillus cereus]|uniref:hypothetical protein n=1 Tax=Bacillus cereus group TaxID=86661 RepID=UPI003012C7FC